MNTYLIKIAFVSLITLIANNAISATSDELFKEAFYIYKERTLEAKKKSFPIFKEAALKGHIKASGLIGSMLMYGDGVPKDEKAGVHWLQKASDGNETVAMMNLAMAYGRGAGVKEPNPYMTLSLLQRAEALGEDRASQFIKKNNMRLLLPVFQESYFLDSKVNNEFNEKLIYLEGVIKKIEYSDNGKPLVEISIPRYNVDSFWVASQVKLNKQDFEIGHTIRVVGHLAPDTEKDPITKNGRYVLGACWFSMNSQYASFFKFSESTCNNWLQGV